MLFSAFFGGFLLLGFLLLINHPGFAIKVANYVYLLLVVIALIRAVKYAKQK